MAAMPSARFPRPNQHSRTMTTRGGSSYSDPAERVIQPLSAPPPKEGTAADIAEGGNLFTSWCSRCHQPGSVLIPDLRRMEGGIDQLDIFKKVVLEGLLAAGGMERFNDVLKPHDVEQIHAYLVDQAHELYAAEN